jgi:phage repressor protein C with HTH and peptisase S24 domain
MFVSNSELFYLCAEDFKTLFKSVFKRFKIELKKYFVHPKPQQAMIREDRVLLNDRFVKVFQILESKGVIVKNDRNGRGVGDVAEKVLGNKSYGHIIRAYLDTSSKRVIDYGQARAFCRAYGVSEEFVIEGTGSPFATDTPNSEIYNMYLHTENKNNGNILFTTTQAFAGSTAGLDTFARESNNFFSLPGITGNNLVAFPIMGNSMEPIICNGDVVVCREMGNFNDIKENDIYAVRSNGSVWVKYVQVIKTRGRVSHLKLMSANYLEHDPFTEEVTEHTRLYKVIRRISQF